MSCSRSFVTLAALMALSSLGCGNLGGTGGADAGPKEEDERIPVEVVPARLGSVEELLRFDGKLLPLRQVEVALEVQGRIEEIKAEEGDRVRAGQELLLLRNPELQITREQAQLALRRAELSLRDLQSQEKVQEGLREKGYVAEEVLEGIRRQRAQAALSVQDARIALRQVALQVSRLHVKAPFEGVVARRLVDSPGQQVTPGLPAFTVVDASELLLKQGLPEPSVRRLRLDMPGAVSPVEDPSRSVPARLLRLAPVVDPATGFQQITLALAPRNAAELDLKPGMFVRASLRLAEHTDAVLVDKRSVGYQGDRPRLFVVEDGVAKAVEPTLGISSGDEVEIRAGVSAGQAVVVLGQSKLRDGVAVKVVSSPNQKERAASPDAGPPAAASGAPGAPDLGPSEG